MSTEVLISAVVPVCDIIDDSGTLASEYIEELAAYGETFELIYVLDGEHDAFLSQLNDLAESEPRLRIVQLATNFGEATALTAGFAHASGNVIVTLPAYRQIGRGELKKVLQELSDCDVAVATRDLHTSTSSSFNRLRRTIFHWLVRGATGQLFRDVGCGVRALKRDVVEELPIYGDQYRFFPVLAGRRGFRVNQVSVTETSPPPQIHHGLRSYLARILDIFAMIFLTRFTKKPLRFFGTVGTIVFAFGSIVLSVILIQRLFFGVALADRPALFLASLFVVLGVQIFALGLLGELVIFTHARDMKEYTIEKIVN